MSNRNCINAYSERSYMRNCLDLFGYAQIVIIVVELERSQSVIGTVSLIQDDVVLLKRIEKEYASDIDIKYVIRGEKIHSRRL